MPCIFSSEKGFTCVYLKPFIAEICSQFLKKKKKKKSKTKNKTNKHTNKKPDGISSDHFRRMMRLAEETNFSYICSAM